MSNPPRGFHGNRYTGSMVPNSLANRILAVLADGPSTLHEIVEATGLDYDNAKGTVARLHQFKRIHISDWSTEFRGGMHRQVAVYSLGEKRDKPRPPTMTRAERQRLYRARKAARNASVFNPAAVLAAFPGATR